MDSAKASGMEVEGAAVSQGDAQRWLRPATDKEEYFEIAHQNCLCLTFYSLALSASKPLKEDLVRRALVHLYRHVPVLRVCLGQRDGRLWLREMDGCRLDFQVVEGGVEEDEEEKLMDYAFNTAEGPMWCGRFLPAAQGLGGVILLGVHHSLADGFTNIRICNLLHVILDDLLAERVVDDEEQLGEHVGDEEAERLYERERQRFLHDPDLYRRRREELVTATKPRPPLLSVLAPPRDGDIKTRSVKLILDEATTRAFRSKCKAEGASLHCGLTGVTNVALVRMLEALAEAPPEYNFVTSHDLGLRRYYEGDTSRILGSHIPTFSFKMSLKTPRNVVNNFWPYVKEFHGRFHAALKDRVPMQAVAVRLMEKSKADNFKEYFRTTADPDYSYALSNMADVSHMLPGNGDFVQATRLTRFSTLRSSATIMCLYVHTFRGRLNINLAYSTRFLERHEAQRILSLMHETITSLC
ncbi:uncharacterized protein LOC126983967 isoform X1 [Eriocheir sinensis]|uniref:uncharacterized protein LOC126983967 isoform X1 n=2 Tax=Eriocheir sinensis TaxID=95602 RepID=UPI0021C600A7|nr:uncharacterized protein LOC126983967 isoform X1 [Eriocheir sinensis]